MDPSNTFDTFDYASSLGADNRYQWKTITIATSLNEWRRRTNELGRKFVQLERRFDAEISSISNAQLALRTGPSVIGRASNTSGQVTDILAATDGLVLRRFGNSISFGFVGAAGIANAAIDGTKLAIDLRVPGQISFANQNALTAASGNVTPNFNSGNICTWTRNSNVTFSSPTNQRVGTYIFVIYRGTGGTVSWSSQYRFPNGQPPFLSGNNASPVDVISCVSAGGPGSPLFCTHSGPFAN